MLHDTALHRRCIYYSYPQSKSYPKNIPSGIQWSESAVETFVKDDFTRQGSVSMLQLALAKDQGVGAADGSDFVASERVAMDLPPP